MKNKFLTFIMIASIFLIFSNLGDRILFGDETYVALVGKTVLESGFPRGLYKGYIINPKDEATAKTAYIYKWGVDVYTWNPWLQEYLAAGSLAMFGLKAFFLRFPFALFGLATIFIMYFFVKFATKNRKIALLSTFLLAMSVTFLLHVRQVRYYAPSIFFTVCVLYSYLFLFEHIKKRWSVLYFVISSLFLFHTNFLIFFGVFSGLLIHFLIFNLSWRNVKKFLFSLMFIIAGTIPWFLITEQFAKGSGLVRSISYFLVYTFLNYYYVFVLLFPFVFVLLLIYFAYCRNFGRENRKFLNFLIIVVVFYIFFISIRSDQIPTIRYLTPLIPLFCFINAYVIYYVFKKWDKTVAIILIVLLIFTNVLTIFPFVFARSVMEKVDTSMAAEQESLSDYEKKEFLDKTLTLRFHFLNYLYEITHDYTSSQELIINYMLENGKKDDTFVAYDFEIDTVLYTDMKAVKINNFRVDWIILRNFKIDLGRTKKLKEEMERYIDISKYKKITLPGTDQRWGDAPDPINHNYKTNLNNEIMLYHLKES